MERHKSRLAGGHLACERVVVGDDEHVSTEPLTVRVRPGRSWIPPGPFPG